MPSLATLILAVAAFLPAAAGATCTRISYAASYNYLPSSIYYIDPAAGTHAIWAGALDGAGSGGNLPAVVNINNSTFQPYGSVIASGSASFLQLGNEPYTPEQVLYRCDATDAGSLYEFYATNGDSSFGGMYDDGAALGVPNAYRTAVKGMAIRITNAVTGEYYSRMWKSRQLTGLDRDSQGKILVKAKNFSDVRIELIRVSNETDLPVPPLPANSAYTYSQPAAYIAFKAPGISANIEDGRDSAYYYAGWYGDWPGAVNLYQHLTTRSAATCAVTSVTPHVLFPTISVAELNQGGTRQAPVDIVFQCQTGAPANAGLTAFSSGTGAGQTAMGVLVPPANYQLAASQQLVTAGAGATYLLSDGYGTDPGVATGVGIALTRADASNTALNFLGSDLVMGGGAGAGWYPVLDGAGPATGPTNGVNTYTKRLNATLKQIPGKTVTPGAVRARAHVVIRVQ